jgi:hypothetical protein
LAKGTLFEQYDRVNRTNLTKKKGCFVFSGMQQCFGSGSTMQYYCFVITALDKIFEKKGIAEFGY